MNDYQVKIKNQYVDDDNFAIEMGTTSPRQAWWEMPLPHCPDCDGDLVWWENGYVPGTRRCIGKMKNGHYDLQGGCGSLFSVQTAAKGRVFLRRERMY